VFPPAPAIAEPAPAPGSVTLITGDRVELSPTGSPKVTPAAGREAMQYRITGEDGNVRVIPLDAGYADAANPDLGLIVRHGDGAARSAPALREERALPDVYNVGSAQDGCGSRRHNATSHRRSLSGSCTSASCRSAGPSTSSRTG